ncbi:hypothetical protein ACFWN1_05005 [Streptomyces sp. NPDC058459]|uniref:hypothetical protein n=1 Tax=Streptomyces sp. NPDC058459 TaxID=3346508 RepID=UPI003648C41D
MTSLPDNSLRPLRRLDTGPRRLNDTEAAARPAEHGKNTPAAVSCVLRAAGARRADRSPAAVLVAAAGPVGKEYGGIAALPFDPARSTPRARADRWHGCATSGVSRR